MTIIKKRQAVENSERWSVVAPRRFGDDWRLFFRAFEINPWEIVDEFLTEEAALDWAINRDRLGYVGGNR